MTSRKRIAIDMDEVIADVEPVFLDLYEAHFGLRLKHDDYWGRKIYQMPGAEKIRETLFEKGFFARLPVLEGSREGVQWLQQHYEVYIVTAAMEFRNSLEDKFDWLQRHFPFIHWKQVILCGDKRAISADYMIDDHPHNLETFEGKGLLFTATHNIHEDRFERVDNWKEVRAFFERELTRARESR